MEGKNETEAGRTRPRVQAVILILLIIVLIVLAGWLLVTVGSRSQVPSSDFVNLPTTQLSSKGEKVVFVSVSNIAQNGLAVGVEGYLKTASGAPVTGAEVYMTYYLRGLYRTQVATTDQNGHFEARFPMNWTGGLPLTLTYFGDDQHQGLAQTFSIPGDSS
jgi:flagellar biogenesis protein FliO